MSVTAGQFRIAAVILIAVVSAIIAWRERGNGRLREQRSVERANVRSERQAVEQKAMANTAQSERILRLGGRYGESSGTDLMRILRVDLYYALVGLNLAGVDTKAAEVMEQFKVDDLSGKTEALSTVAFEKFDALAKLVRESQKTISELEQKEVEIGVEIAALERQSSNAFMVLQLLTLATLLISTFFE